MAYASRVLSSAETRYSQIEKEALGITYGLEKFHPFVYGRRVIAETDHKPLLAIAQKKCRRYATALAAFFLEAHEV